MVSATWWLFVHASMLHKQPEMHGCVLSTVDTDALVPKHQAISIHSADQLSIALDQFQTNYYIYSDNQKRILFFKNDPVV